MFGIDDPLVLTIIAAVSAIITFACYDEAQQPPRGWWIAGGIVAGCFCLNTIFAIIENALSSFAAGVAGGGIGLLLLVLLVLVVSQMNNSPRDRTGRTDGIA